MRPEILIIGDDMTGVNASGVLLARQGLTCATFFSVADYCPAEHQNLDVVAVSTDSRSVAADTAYQRVEEAMRTFYDDSVKLVNKRIDSTLRGNIGREIMAIKAHMPSETLAVVVPVFPASGRVCIGGYLMVNQIPLEKTSVAKDPKNPISMSKVVPLLEGQMYGAIGFVELSQVLQGPAAITAAMRQQYQAGIRVIVVDATTDEDISAIAKAAKAMQVPLIAVDPGPFTCALALELLEKNQQRIGRKVMLTVGSVTENTRRQLEDIRLKYANNIVNVQVLDLIDSAKREQEIERVIALLTRDIEKYEVFGVTTTSWESDILDLHQVAAAYQTTEDEISRRISQGLALITRLVIERLGTYVGGLFTSGGDVTVAVCHELQAASIAVKDEVLPLAVYGRIRNGIFDNCPIITKGGLIGDDSAISKCVDYLLIKLSNESQSK